MILYRSLVLTAIIILAGVQAKKPQLKTRGTLASRTSSKPCGRMPRHLCRLQLALIHVWSLLAFIHFWDLSKLLYFVTMILQGNVILTCIMTFPLSRCHGAAGLEQFKIDVTASGRAESVEDVDLRVSWTRAALALKTAVRRKCLFP
jgi:hypothetical protein